MDKYGPENIMNPHFPTRNIQTTSTDEQSRQEKPYVVFFIVEYTSTLTP